ncbi:MAG: hypothetical protein ACHQJ4_01415 [Ignavibacteria bacterium]
MTSMKILLCSGFCCALFLCGCSNTSSPTGNSGTSSPQWGSSFNPVIGDTLTVRLVDTNSLSSPGASGNGVTWDFSAIVITVTAPGIPFISPIGTPYIASFPTATVCNVVGTEYGYSQTSSNANVTLGYGQSGIAVVYTHPQTITLPMNYQDSQTDTSWWSTGGQQLWEKDVITYDAVGTLKVPGGSYSNIIRIHVNRVFVDSISASNVVTTTSDSYQWYKASYPFFVFAYSTSSSTINPAIRRSIEINKFIAP